jgi:hypothetical protein
MLLVGATDCSTALHIAKTSNTSSSVQWALWVDSSNSWFVTKTYACASIAFLAKIISWSVDSNKFSSDIISTRSITLSANLSIRCLNQIYYSPPHCSAVCYFYGDYNVLRQFLWTPDILSNILPLECMFQINALLMVDIIRVLCTKLRTVNTVKSNQIRWGNILQSQSCPVIEVRILHSSSNLIG